jgi:hypothetical protein
MHVSSFKIILPEVLTYPENPVKWALTVQKNSTLYKTGGLPYELFF